MDSLHDLKKIIYIELVHMFGICSAKGTLWHFAVAGIYSSGNVYICIDLLCCLAKKLFKLLMSKSN